MAAQKKRKERRALARDAEKLANSKERLLRLEPGGAPERPIDLDSASQVEVHARSMGCVHCGGDFLVDEHSAKTVSGARLRVVAARCAKCGARRTIYFRLREQLLN